MGLRDKLRRIRINGLKAQIAGLEAQQREVVAIFALCERENRGVPGGLVTRRLDLSNLIGKLRCRLDQMGRRTDQPGEPPADHFGDDERRSSP